jgi:hypothetical protein
MLTDLVLRLTVLALALFSRKLWRERAALRARLAAAEANARRAAAPFEEDDSWDPFPRFILLAKGGNNQEGLFKNLKENTCPCTQLWAGRHQQTRQGFWPTAAQIASCAAVPPPEPEWKCLEPCTPVMTHTWQGWSIYWDVMQGCLLLSCNTYGQFHCKLPDDPDRDKPPKTFPPGEIEK